MNLSEKTRAIQAWSGAATDGIYGNATADAIIARAGIAAAPSATGLANPHAFFEAVRRKGIMGDLDQSEVDGLNTVLDACGAAGFGIAWTAYCLGTTFHETAGRMQPIHEFGTPARFRWLYDIEGGRPKKARELGNTEPGDGVKFAGRGFVQLTGRGNYAKATEKLRAMGLLDRGRSLVDEPDLAMDPTLAGAIMAAGMREGWFTGRRLADDLPATGPGEFEDFVESRDIINGRDKQRKIAADAAVFQDALVVGGWR